MCYLDVDRSDKDKTSRVWHKLKDKVNQAIAKGESTILLGDLNRPLNNDRPSFGTKLLNDWIEEGYVKLINNRTTPTRFDPVTGKGSTLDLGIISKNLIRAVLKFEVDSNRTPTRFDPVTGKGSTLDLGIISKNLIREVLNFKVDSKRSWTPTSMQKKGYNTVVKKPLR